MLSAMPACASSSSFDLKDVLGAGKDVSSTVGNLIQGVFTTSDLEVSDLAGVWTANGSAVSFKSENFLKKAGGATAAAAIEAKLDPYYKQYGLTGGVMTIQTDGSFTFKMSKITLTGNITKGTDGNFIFNFKAFGAISLGKMPTYVTKSSKQLDIMFDATKLKGIISSVAAFSGSTLAKTAAEILDSYEGMYVGFKMAKTGTVKGESSSDSVVKSVLENILNR